MVGENFLDRLTGLEGRVAVVSLGNPDPDAIASAFALGKLLEFHDVNYDYLFESGIHRPENQLLVNYLGISIKQLELGEWKDRQVEKVGELPKWVFSTLREGNAGKKLTIQQVWKTLKTYAEKAGIEKDISPHTLRHTFATDLYRETGKIRLVQKALGHADLSTTMIYTHIVDDELEDALKSFRGEKRQPVANA